MCLQFTCSGWPGPSTHGALSNTVRAAPQVQRNTSQRGGSGNWSSRPLPTKVYLFFLSSDYCIRLTFTQMTFTQMTSRCPIAITTVRMAHQVRRHQSDAFAFPTSASTTPAQGRLQQRDMGRQGREGGWTVAPIPGFVGYHLRQD